MIYLDTHILLWLYEGLERKFNVKAKRKIVSSELRVSPMVLLELQYLYEIGKEKDTPKQVLSGVSRLTQIQVSKNRFDKIVEFAEGLTWTRDPFDRMIVAEAMLEDAPLVTADENIRKHYKQAVW